MPIRQFTFKPIAACAKLASARGRIGGKFSCVRRKYLVSNIIWNALGQRIFKTEPLYPPASSATSATTLAAFASQPWNPGSVPAEGLGYAFMYDEDGTLLSEVGTGGAQSAGSTYYIYLPTASGPMPIAAVINGTNVYAVHSDHLNTPRRLTRSDGHVVWQWAYSAFGDEQPTTAAKRFTSPTTIPTTGRTHLEAVTFNLRYPGQVADGETGLSYNYFRSYDARTGRYTQGDPIGMDGGWNRFAYVGGNAVSRIDPLGLDDFPVIYSGGAGTLWVVPPGSGSAEGFPAGNNTTSSSRGPWAPGTYTYGYPTTHKDDGPTSAYGSNGNAVFSVPGCVGCGVHSGRQGVLDKRGGSGVQHVTEGCIRTTDDATKLMQDLIRQGHRPVLEVTR